MCGIAGVLGTPDQVLIERLTESLRHRGPDGRGHFSRGRSHIGATRLSIIGLNSGAQPIYNETGQLALVFNGEIYNHRPLRLELESKGHVFSTQTDAEVVVHAYEEFGVSSIQRLRGMFAFAILDAEKLLLVRDRLGIKPLYYSSLNGGKQFIFASEIKAILQYPDFSPHLSMQAFADSQILGHPIRDYTFFEGVRLLPAGHFVTVLLDHKLRVQDPQPYFAGDVLRDNTMRLDDAMNQLEEVLEDAIETHLAADVEVGVTLSGGIDSTLMTLFAHDLQDEPLTSFTVADHDLHPDVQQASFVATMIGAKHHNVIMTFSQYLEAIPALVAAEEQPSSLTALPFFFLCRTISQRLKACLHGEGADELFGGYREYLHKGRRLSYYGRRLPLLKRLGILPSEGVIDTISRLSSPVTFDEYLDQIFRVNLGDALQRQHLDIVDKCAMAASLEMRVPYLDDQVFDVVTRFPVRLLVSKSLGIQKYVLRRLALRRFGPDFIDVILRDKLGAPSAGLLFLNQFDEMCNESLPDDYITKHPLGFCFSSKRHLLLFELFVEIFLRQRAATAAVPDIREFIRERACGSRTELSLA
jgi:asparagine synthase (glutamine-hydrolysing)